MRCLEVGQGRWRKGAAFVRCSKTPGWPRAASGPALANLGSGSSVHKHGFPRTPSSARGVQCLPRGNRPRRQIRGARWKSGGRGPWRGRGCAPRAPVGLPAAGLGCPGVSMLPPQQRDQGGVRSSWSGRGLAELPPTVWLNGSRSLPQAWCRGLRSIRTLGPVSCTLRPHGEVCVLRCWLDPIRHLCQASSSSCLAPWQILGVPRREFSILVLGVCSLRRAQATWAPGAQGVQSRLLGQVCRAPWGSGGWTDPLGS